MSENPKSGWFRFCLRSLLILVILLAVPLAWIAKERRQSQHEMQIAKALQIQGFSDVFVAGPYDSQEDSPRPAAQPLRIGFDAE